MEEYHRLQFSNFEEQHLGDDIYLCELANTRRQKLFSSPTQSFFRVYALLIVSIPSGTGKAAKESLYLVDGANSEQGVSSEAYYYCCYYVLNTLLMIDCLFT